VCLALGAALCGCGSDAPEREARKVTELQPELLAGNDAFAWSLYSELAQQPGNLFCSPFSIESALGMTYAGARATTAAEMHDALHIQVDDASFHAGIGALSRDLSGDRGRGYTIYIANRLFGQDGFGFHQDFTDLLHQNYGAALEPLDFYGNAEAARQRVNDWADGATHGTIPELFPAGSLDDTTVLVLANAIYFRAAWAQAFDVKDTLDAPFHRGDGSTVTVPMMSSSDHEFAHTSDALADVVELPYQDDEISALLVVPKALDGLPEVEAALPSGWLEGLAADLGEPYELLVMLPRFTMKWHSSLVAPLQALGMTSAFDPSQADFSGVADDSLFIAAVEHSAYVKVDEAGTVAAAATAVGESTTSAPLGVSADHPFLFVIRDRLTQSILFVARVDDPTDVGGG
jgi:serine protease inhibitor